MKFQSFDVIEKTIVRLETILEVDTSLDVIERTELEHARDILIGVYEKSKSTPS